MRRGHVPVDGVGEPVVRNAVLRRYLFDRSVGYWRYLLRTFLIKEVGVVTLATLLAVAVWLAGGDVTEGNRLELGGSRAVVTILVAPILETFLLAGLIVFLRNRLELKSANLVAAISGLLWGVLHAWGAATPIGLAPGWGFYVYSAAWMTWRPVSFRAAYGAAALPHMVHNAVLVLLVG